MKVDKVCSFQPALQPSSAEEEEYLRTLAMSTVSSQRSLSFFLTYFLSFYLSRFSFYINISLTIVMLSVLRYFPFHLLFVYKWQILEPLHSFVDAVVLPGGQGYETNVFTVRTSLHLSYKLRQLGVCSTAEIYLRININTLLSIAWMTISLQSTHMNRE